MIAKPPNIEIASALKTIKPSLPAMITLWILSIIGYQHQVVAQHVPVHFSLPLKQLVVTSPYGYRIHPISGKRAFHHGTDFSASADTVYAVIDGLVESTGYHHALGRFVRLNHGQITTVYGHLSAIGVQQGQLVKSGQALAITGSTGKSTGEHLHFTVKYDGRTVNPMILLLLLQRLSQLNLIPE